MNGSVSADCVSRATCGEPQRGCSRPNPSGRKWSIPATNGMRATEPSHAPTLPSTVTATSRAATGVTPGTPSRCAPDRIACITASRPLTLPAGSSARIATVPPM